MANVMTRVWWLDTAEVFPNVIRNSQKMLVTDGFHSDYHETLSIWVIAEGFILNPHAIKDVRFIWRVKRIKVTND